MEASKSFDQFVPAGLASLGIEVDDAELGVMRSAHELYWPAMAGLLTLDLGPVEPEPCPDLSKPPSEGAR
jgi:hypothetical protein